MKDFGDLTMLISVSFELSRYQIQFAFWLLN